MHGLRTATDGEKKSMHGIILASNRPRGRQTEKMGMKKPCNLCFKGPNDGQAFLGLIWGGIGQFGFILVQRIISDVRGQNMSSPRLFEIATLSTLLSGQSFGQELPGILLSPDFSPHALRQDGETLRRASFRAIPRLNLMAIGCRGRKSSTGTPMTCPASTGDGQTTAPMPRG